MTDLEKEIRKTLDFLVQDAERLRWEIVQKLETKDDDPLMAWFHSPIYVAAYQLQHSMNYLVLNMNLPKLAAEAAYIAKHGEETS